MKPKVAFIADNGAFGDQAYNLCQINSICNYHGIDAIDIHTSRKFFYNNGADDMHIKEPNPDVFYLWSQCSIINSINFTINHFDYAGSISRAKENSDILYSGNLEDKMIVKNHKIKDILNIPKVHKDEYIGRKIAVFQPVSFIHKRKELIDFYLIKWNLALRALIEKGYSIYMVGGNNDEQLIREHGLIHPSCIPYLFNLIGKLTYIQSLALILDRADFVLSCDSWAGLYGIANRVPTCITWGPKVEKTKERRLIDYLGNKDIYHYNWTTQGDTDKDFYIWIQQNL